jgi:WD40 repeat protein
VVWSPDGLTIASGGWDNTLRIWNAETGEEIKVIASNSLWFESVAWSPDGAYIAAGHKDGTIYIINAQTWNIENKLYGHNSAHGGGVPIISWAPDGTKLASGGRDEEKVFIWNKSGVRLHEFHGQPLSVFGLSWSPDSRMIASSGEGQSVVITDISTGSELIRLENHQPNTYSVSWSPNGKLFATVTANGQIRIFGVKL